MKWVEARRVPVLLGAATTLLSIAVLGWLGMHTLQQDRLLERQRQRERLEVATGRVALGIERRLRGIEERIAKGAGIRFLASGIESSEDTRILFQPLDAPPTPALSPPSLAWPRSTMSSTTTIAGPMRTRLSTRRCARCA